MVLIASSRDLQSLPSSSGCGLMNLTFQQTMRQDHLAPEPPPPGNGCGNGSGRPSKRLPLVLAAAPACLSPPCLLLLVRRLPGLQGRLAGGVQLREAGQILQVLRFQQSLRFEMGRKVRGREERRDRWERGRVGQLNSQCTAACCACSTRTAGIRNAADLRRDLHQPLPTTADTPPTP